MTSDKMPTGTTGGTPQVLLAHHLQAHAWPLVRDLERLRRALADRARP